MFESIYRKLRGGMIPGPSILPEENKYIQHGSAEDMYDLYKHGKIELELLGDLLSFDEVEQLHNKGIMSDYEYNYIKKYRG